MVNKNDHFVNRKIMLMQAGFTVKTLAEKIGMTKQTVHPAISGKSTSYRCHSLIARELQRPLVEIWPELYAVVPEKEISHDSIVNNLSA